tara:strand:- start:5925 stop:6299 length:375 start_codon:yes stop_codon:yes gene_type:complete
MINEKVKEKLKGRTWTFQEISNINDVISTISNELYDDLNTKEKIDMVWDSIVDDNSGLLFGELFQNLVMNQLDAKIADTIKTELQTANVNFKRDDKNEVSKRSMGRKPLEERTTNEKSNSKKPR